MSDGDSLSDLADVLDDPYCREILSEASRSAVSVNELSDAIEADPSTVYRRLDRLEALDLVSTELTYRRDGHHYRRYRTKLRRVSVELIDGEYRVDVDRVSTDPADRLTDLFEELR
jgi:DNA-binding transcriptional ArsR family regulator